MKLLYNNFYDMIAAAFAAVPDKEAFVWITGDTRHKKTYSEFHTDVLRFAQGLRELELPEYSHVAMIGENSYTWMVTFFGTVIGGYTALPLDKDMTIQEVETALQESDARVICYAEEYGEELQEIALPDHLMCFAFDNLPDAAPAKAFPCDPAMHSVTILTSGTTAKRKGVMLSQQTILSSSTMSKAGKDPLPPLGNVLLCLPFHHIFALSMMIFQLLSYETACITASLRHLPRDMSVFAPDSIPFVPMHIEAFYKKALALVEGDTARLPEVLPKIFGGKMKNIVAGGAYLDPKYIIEYKRCGIRIVNCYGISECSPLISLGSQQNCPIDSVGAPCADSIVTIMHPDHHGIGEICVKGPQVMLGYYKQPEQTAEVLIEGVFHTGDLGRLDEKGFLYITGRKKYLIIASNGENISPEELEIPVLQLPYVQEGVCYQEGDEIVIEVYFAPQELEVKGLNVLRDQFDKDLNLINGKKVSHKRINRFKVRDIPFEKTTAQKIKRSSHML